MKKQTNGDLGRYSGYEISESIQADYEQIFTSKEIKDFKDGLSYKSPKSAQRDLAALDFLLRKLEVYKKGWILCSFNQTNNLAEILDYNQVQQEKILETTMQINDWINRVIKSMKKMIPEEKLDGLRALEMEFRKLTKNLKNE